ncbi:Zinc finger BED domain-containing protein [Melia azedarach]|uniref:Zinc finger BED domain-containing protein n=1 Tax=Melia azedarach TaxID=155640 RepID=A0ACC1YIG6_MELAZ|nr:Zinc finger BED domain-containing protein [Melia azedarach]
MVMNGSCNENLDTHQPHGQASSPAMDVSSSSVDEFCARHQPHGQEMTEGREVDGNQAGNNIEMDIVMNQQDLPAGNSATKVSGSLPNNEFFSKEQEMIEEREVHGNETGNNIGKEILAADQPHAQEMIEGRELHGNQGGNNIEKEILATDLSHAQASSGYFPDGSMSWEKMHGQASSGYLPHEDVSWEEILATNQPPGQASSLPMDLSPSFLEECLGEFELNEQEIAEGEEVDGNQGNNVVMNQHVPGNSAMEMSGSLSNKEFFSTEQEMNEDRQVHGNQAGSNIEKEILATHQPHAQEITEGREGDGIQGNNVEMNIVTNHQHIVLGNSAAMEMSGSLLSNEILATGQEMIEVREVHGNQSGNNEILTTGQEVNEARQIHGNQAGNNIVKEILATHQPHAQLTIEDKVNANQAGNNIEIVDINHQDVVGNSSLSVSNTQRKKQSKVWKEMTKYKGADGRDCARCNHCEKEFDGSSKKGTTHLNNHLVRCRRKRNSGGEDVDKSKDQTTNLTSSVVIQEKSVFDLIKSCFDEDGYLNDEWYGTYPEEIFAKGWDPIALNSRKVEILQVYKEAKEELSKCFSQLSCRFSLLIEAHSGYYLLKVCYTDNSWEPKRKAIGFYAANMAEERQHNYPNLVKFLKESCLDLKIDENICSIIYDDPTDDYFITGDGKDVIGEINCWFNHRGNSLPYIGFLCSVEMLESLCSDFEQSWAEWLWRTFGGLKKCIGYVNSTPSNNHNFQIAVDNAKSTGKKVDNSDPFPKNGDSVYDFKDAVGFKEAFCELELINSDFKSRSINLTANQWDEATAICEHFNKLWGVFNTLSAGGYTTLTQCFTDFYRVYIRLLPLLQISQSYHHDKEASTMTEKFVSKLEKYNLFLVIAVILDPRFKMDMVQLWYKKIYGPNADVYFKKVKNDFTNIYKEYYAKVFESGDTTSSYLDAMGRLFTFSPKSSELKRYLNDPKVPSVAEFDILAWWRAYTPIFPTLARMARDFLAIPFFDCYRHLPYFVIGFICDLKFPDDDIKQAFLCLSEWFKSPEK